MFRLLSNWSKGTTSSYFYERLRSNHTLVMLNGIAINDQSATSRGLHDFGQDFIQTIQQVEVYKGANGAHFGPDAIGGAVNFVDVDYIANYSINGFNFKNNLSITIQQKLLKMDGILILKVHQILIKL